MNSVNMVGRLTRDPELKTTNTGKSVCSFCIAVDRQFKSQDGPTADFFECTAWGQPGEFLNQYGGKGRVVGVSGRVENREYEDKDGNKRKVTNIIADRVQLLDKKSDTPTGAAATPATEGEPYDPFGSE
jgi:single-strand DNA-binding protein